MKKRVLAVLLAVCMIFGTCVLFASAADKFAAGTYVEKINASGSLMVDNLKAISTSAFNINVTVAAKSSITLNLGTTKVTADNVDDIVEFKAGTSTLTYAKNLKDYFNVDGTVTESGAIVVKFTDKTANDLTVYSVNSAIADTETDVSAKVTAVSPCKKYNLSAATVTANVSKWATKLASFTMGVRFFGSTYNNLVASEIAVVNATITRSSGAVKPVTTAVTNKIEDLMPGDKIHLTTSLKDEAEKEFYGFYCWVDGSGNVVSTNEELDIVMDGNSGAVYATYVELKNRYTINYSSRGNGSVVYEEGREVFKGDAQISVLADRNATFTFVPDEGYEVSKVLVDGVNVASLMNLVNTSDFLGALKILIKATNKDSYSYTFNKVDKNHTIEVEFIKSEIIEAPTGKDMETVAAEGITLATGEDAANGGNATTVPAEKGAAADGSAATGVVNPATGSASAIAVFAVLSVAAGAAFVTAKKKED